MELCTKIQASTENIRGMYEGIQKAILKWSQTKHYCPTKDKKEIGRNHSGQRDQERGRILPRPLSQGEPNVSGCAG